MKKQYLQLCQKYDPFLMGSVSVLSLLGVMLSMVVTSTFFFLLFFVSFCLAGACLMHEWVEMDYYITKWILRRVNNER